MSDFDTTPVPTESTGPFRETLAGHAARDASLHAANKAALFAALAPVNITHVVVTFDGYGDEGQIVSIEARKGEDATELPATNVVMAVAEWGKPEPVIRDMPIAEAIEHLAYGFLGHTHAGWQDGDGAYGEFVFDVAAGTITLDHNERYTAVESYSHEF